MIPAVTRSIRDWLAQHDSGKRVLFGFGANGGILAQIEDLRDGTFLLAEHTCEWAQAAFTRYWLLISARLSLTKQAAEEEVLVSRHSKVVQIGSRDIHLDDLADAALELDGVSEAVAVVAPDPFGTKNAVIFFTASGHADSLAIRIETCLTERFLSDVLVQMEQSLPQLPTGAPDVPQLIDRATHLLRVSPQASDSLAIFRKTSPQVLPSNGIEGHMLFMSMFAVLLGHANTGLGFVAGREARMATNDAFAYVFAGGSFPMTICIILSGRSEAVADAGREYVRRKIYPLFIVIGIWLLSLPGLCTHYVPALTSAAPGLDGFLERVAPPATMLWFTIVLVICRITRFFAFSLRISPRLQAMLATVVHLATSLRLIRQTPGERVFNVLKWVLPPALSGQLRDVTRAGHFLFVFFTSPLCAPQVSNHVTAATPTPLTRLLLPFVPCEQVAPAGLYPAASDNAAGSKPMGACVRGGAASRPTDGNRPERVYGVCKTWVVVVFA